MGVEWEKMKTEPYRPSNGTEGALFMDEWCAKCRRDRAFREDENELGCPIISAAMLYQEDDPKYPNEWICDTEGEWPWNPRCTAFEPIAEEGVICDPRQDDLL